MSKDRFLIELKREDACRLIPEMSDIQMWYHVFNMFLWIKDIEKGHNYGIIRP